MKIGDIEAYLRKDSEFFWADRLNRVQTEILAAQAKASLTGMDHSSSLMSMLQKACETGLDDLLAAHLDALRRVLEGHKPPLTKKLLTSLAAAFPAVLAPICSGLNARLAGQAKLIGFKNEWTVDGRADLLKAKATNELSIILAHHREFLRSTHKPWYDRPLGRVAIAAVAGILASLVFLLLKVKLGW